MTVPVVHTPTFSLLSWISIGREGRGGWEEEEKVEEGRGRGKGGRRGGRGQRGDVGRGRPQAASRVGVEQGGDKRREGKGKGWRWTKRKWGAGAYGCTLDACMREEVE